MVSAVYDAGIPNCREGGDLIKWFLAVSYDIPGIRTHAYVVPASMTFSEAHDMRSSISRPQTD